MGVTSQIPAELFEREAIWSASIVSKLQELNRPDLYRPLADCHRYQTHFVCQSCHHETHALNRCDRFYCPLCVGRLAWRRRQKIAWWVKTVPEPKHIVLTQRNSSTFSKTYVHKFQKSLRSLRRSSTFRQVSGGLCSLEVTNERRGWHLHAHLLVDGPFIPGYDLSRAWARRVKQDFAIVKIKDCRDQSYLQEVTKYVIKGSILASFNGWEIECFIDAMTGVRCFSTFGSLFKDNALRMNAINALETPSMTCDKCSGEAFWYLDDAEYEAYYTTGKLPW